MDLTPAEQQQLRPDSTDIWITGGAGAYAGSGIAAMTTATTGAGPFIGLAAGFAALAGVVALFEWARRKDGRHRIAADRSDAGAAQGV